MEEREREEDGNEEEVTEKKWDYGDYYDEELGEIRER